MSHRLERGGRLIDRQAGYRFSFNGRTFTGYDGDTLASALLAAGQMVMGRSYKFHRRRGPIAAGPEEPNALMGLGDGERFEPNARATMTEVHPGLVARSQNHWPSLGLDIGAVNGLLAPFFPAGFYYKTFIHPRAAWKHVFEPVVRQAAGLGRVPQDSDADRYQHLHLHADVVVIGGGLAGLEAARAAAATGQRVILWEQSPHWGGRAPVDGVTVAGAPAEDWVRARVAELAARANVTLRTRTQGVGVYDHGWVLGWERLHAHAPGAPGPRERLWKVRAGRVIVAAGAIERPLICAGNDLPGVMLASAVRDHLVNHAVAVGRRTVVATTSDDAYRTALALHGAGLEVPAILDARPEATGPLPEAARAAGLTVLPGRGIAQVLGRGRVRGLRHCRIDGDGLAGETVGCDAVAVSGGWSPAVHLWSHCGGKLVWDEGLAHFRPDPARAPTGADGAPFVAVAGAANGVLDAAGLLADARRAAGADPDGAPDATEAEAAPEAPPRAIWMMPTAAAPKLRAKAFLDFQNDVKVSDIELAAREGYVSVEHAKRYTTLGMATDQGKLSNVNGLAILAAAQGAGIPEVGTTTFRPPWTPVTFGAIAGEAKGATFQPVRRTPLHAWHAAHGADWEPVGQWRRPYCYPGAGEDRAAAVAREIGATRAGVGLLDASTLGKILVSGPDAGRLLDMIYTGVMSSLPPGRCRYGLICNENGFLIDDGVVARLDDTTFLCHTTTGGAERIHAHMEDWLQCEWWDWRVHTLNLTEHYAQIAVAGPKARAVLERLGGMDVSAAALPFLHWAEGTLGGFPARVFRISFTGELQFEIATPAGHGAALWEALLAAGADFGATPYGTEAMHVMRAEKGFIMIGDETDGTVIPQDLGLGWAISRKKPDYIGKRAQMRAHMADPERWKLVGLETLDGSVLPDGALAVTGARNANGQAVTEGRVTSSYHSPTLGRGIAMGLVRQGPARMGEELRFSLAGGGSVAARIVDPVLYDPKGERQNG